MHGEQPEDDNEYRLQTKPITCEPYECNNKDNFDKATYVDCTTDLTINGTQSSARVDAQKVMAHLRSLRAIANSMTNINGTLD